MPAVTVNIRGMDIVRNQLHTYRRGLSVPRTDDLFRRNIKGAYTVAGHMWTPSPIGPDRDPQEWKKERTGNLLGSYSVTLPSRNVVRLRWKAPYASYVNRRGRSRGYVARTAEEGRRRVRRFLREERRKFINRERILRRPQS